MSDIRVRKLTADDAGAFKNLRIEAAHNSPASLPMGPEELSQQPISEFEKQICGPLQITFGAFVAVKLISIAGLRQESMSKRRHRATIWGMYTKEGYRGRGIARQLVDILMNEAKSNPEITMLNLNVHSLNAPAKALYASLGFTCYGTQHNTLLVNGKYIHEEQMELNLGKRGVEF
jgi:ribosomal protein S18 acetylase RimI-like enzyme